MFSLKLYRFGRLSKPTHSYVISHLINSSNVKSFYSTPNLCKKKSVSEERELSEAENQLKRILSERVNPSSPFTDLIDRLVSKPWITFSGEQTKKILVKERKDTTTKKSEIFRLAFDLPGFKQEEIQVVLSDYVVYIEAKKEEIGSDGSKSWREFAFECPIPEDVKIKSVNASIDNDGLLLIEAELPKDKITGKK